MHLELPLGLAVDEKKVIKSAENASEGKQEWQECCLFVVVFINCFKILTLFAGIIKVLRVRLIF